MAISIVVITKNEADVIEGCLESVKWADEIVVVDSGSTDNTVEMAKKYTNNVHVLPFEGFGKQRNNGMQLAKNEWILFIDADERLSSGMKTTIEKILKSENEVTGYDIYFKHYLFGRFLKYGGWFPDPHIRLIKKGSFDYPNDAVDTQISYRGVKGSLWGKGWIYHFSHRNVSEWIRKIKEYGEREAEGLISTGLRKVTVFKMLSVTIKTFLFYYVIKRGFLEGIEGLFEAGFFAFFKFTIYAYAWEKLRSEPLKKTYENLEKSIMNDTIEHKRK